MTDKAASSTTFRVRYQETDQMGFVYYGNYFTWFEVGRTELFRAAGLPYTMMEEQGIYLPVTHAECNYKSSCKYDDLVTVVTGIEKITPVRIQFYYRVLAGDDRVLASGSTTHAFIDSSGRPVNLAKKAPVLWSKIQEIV
ncbi:acyl-CoA thioesterase [bacterium]|nr:MAG: acyl-CoA thioesterase [bacterium]